MNWITSFTDGNGVKTICPPQPRWEDIPTCDMCKGKTQFVHFYPVILKYLKPEAKVPKFCSGSCAQLFLDILQEARSNPKEAK